MRVCACILAGTKACENCQNGSIEIPMRMPVFPGRMKPTITWTTITLSETHNEKNENRKS